MISIVTPAAPNRYERINMIFQRLELNKQRHPNIEFEYIIVDDSLNSEYKDLSQQNWSFRVKYINLPLTEPYPNPAYMRNVGFRIAQGNIFSMIDADHFVHEDFVKGILEAPYPCLNTGFMIDTSKGVNWITSFGPKINQTLIDEASSARFEDCMKLCGIKGPVKWAKVWLASYPADTFLSINGYDEKYTRGYCYDKTAEVLTKNGYKLIKDVDIDEEVWTLNPSTHQGEWQAVQKKYEYNYNGEMYRFKNLLMDLSVTPDHKMWIKNKEWQHIKAKDIKVPQDYRKSQLCPSIRISAETNFNKTIIDNTQKDFVKLIAYYISEGHCRKNQIQISKDPNVFPVLYEDIKNTIHNLGYKTSCSNHTITICNNILSENIGKTCGIGSKMKQIPDIIWNLEPIYQNIFVKTLLSCDGDKENRYSTTSKKLYHQLQRLCVQCGFWISENKSKDETEKWNKCYILKISERSEVKLRTGQITTYHYNDKIYCLTVPNHIILVKSNGKVCYSGQSREDDDIYYRLASKMKIYQDNFNTFAGVHLWHPQAARNQAKNELNKQYFASISPGNAERNKNQEWGKFVSGSYSIIDGRERSFSEHEQWIRDNHDRVLPYVGSLPWQDFEELQKCVNT